MRGVARLDDGGEWDENNLKYTEIVIVKLYFIYDGYDQVPTFSDTPAPSYFGDAKD